MPATTFEGALAIRSVGEEIFQGREQKGTELTFLSIDARVDFALNQIGEKALRKILRVVHGVAAAAHEIVKRRPISLAKLRKGGARKLRFGLTSSRCEHHAPVR